jgi:leucyl/phenylalanyl-tRNA--protein transferase
MAAHPLFPDPRSADEDGIVALGGDFRPEFLLAAYRQGIFPWPMGDDEEDAGNNAGRRIPLTWFSPDPRAMLEFSKLHIPKRLERERKSHGWTYTWGQAFEQVLRECALQPRPGQNGTWITEPLLQGYLELHRQGHAWSVEVWAGTELVGGIYGVLIEQFCSGESMFHRRSDASKCALIHAVGELKARGCQWLDIQMLTPHMQKLGAVELPREEFLQRCKQAMPLTSRI